MKNHIRELIEKRNIKRIVYVDNEFEIDIYKESIKLYLRENISDTSIEWPFPIEAGIEYAMEACNQWLDDNSNNDRISQFIQERNIKRGTHDIEKILNDILPTEILHCVTPNEFKEQYIDNPIYTPTETEQMVVLMDKYLDEDDPNSGMRLLTPFKNKEYVALDYSRINSKSMMKLTTGMIATMQKTYIHYLSIESRKMVKISC